MQNTLGPAYRIASVDNALRLAVALRERPLGVSEAAGELGVARSTAHRLLAMLVHHGFAQQDSDRTYVAGPAMLCTDEVPAAVQRLIWVARPHMRQLTERVQETTNLIMLSGVTARFIESVESAKLLRIGSRTGIVLPAERTSGGRALLAGLSDDELEERYRAAGRPLPAAMLQELDEVRRRGYGLNLEETEKGVRAVGMAVTHRGEGVAAVAIAAPPQRLGAERVRTAVRQLGHTVTAIASDLGHFHTPSM